MVVRTVTAREDARHPPQGWSRPIPGYRRAPRERAQTARDDRDAAMDDSGGVADGQCGHRDSPEPQPDTRGPNPSHALLRPTSPDPHVPRDRLHGDRGHLRHPLPVQRRHRGHRPRPARRRPVHPPVRDVPRHRGLRHHGPRRWPHRRPRAAQPGLPVPGQPALVRRRLRRPPRGGPRRGLRPRRRRAGRRPRLGPVHRPQRRPRRGHRLRAHQLVGRGRLDRLRAPSPPAPDGPGPRQRRHDLDAGRAPPAPRVHRGRRHHRARRPREHPVLPRRAVHPADPGPDDADLDLQRERPQRADRGPVPRGPRRRRRGRVPAR